ncbi:MAG: aspartate aminotransferase family protein, partial [Candidatus Rokubacteria bacterium]|nr:aspartate aminotransferase family protein [Candidatus Rokubacteria bacterium]
SGNPLAVAAGLETLAALREPGVYETLEARAAAVEAGLVEAAAAAGVPVRVNRVGSMLTCFFTERPVVDWQSAKAADTRRYAAFFHGMLERGVYLAPSQYEAAFLSLAHGEDELAATAEAARASFRAL